MIFIYFKSQKAKEEEANKQLLQVQSLYFSGSYQQAISGDTLGMTKGLIYIVDNYGSSESGQTAKVLLANSYYMLGDFDNAMKYYSDYSGKDVILKAASYAGMASVNEAKGDFSSAAKNYEKAANVSKDITINDEYLFNAIRDYFNLKDVDNVKKLSKQIKEDYPKSKYLQQITRYDNSN